VPATQINGNCYEWDFSSNGLFFLQEFYADLTATATGSTTADQFELSLPYPVNGDAQPISLGQTRPSVSREHIAPVRIGEYQARDGLTIPMLLTATDKVFKAGNAPLIVMPHGGPAQHDTFGFDWQAQYFASRGYVVLQPQFRGSTGFGRSHEFAGRGEWGGKMQTDLDDGVDFLVEQGVADSRRVCIVGGSYGGYAALAAGAFTPDRYRCVVSFAGVSDLPEMLKDESRERGADHWVVSYWADQFGSDEGKEKLRSISPYFHAENFKAPVLLIHGRNDTVVPADQSMRMERALKRADKDVEFVLLKGEDHYYTNAETRIEALGLMSDFIEKHNPAD
jgi:dipeptidyl aminopeptidase/acylaminoacyl peptidase